jgi:hypothetical protein
MTFVLNLIHKDFSLVAADKQGNSDGPTTLTTGGLKIHVKGKLTIEGMNKITLTTNKKMALGFAGNTGAHNYRDAFVGSETPKDGMLCIRRHMESYFNFDQRDLFLEGKGQMENAVLLSFFDNEKSAYFTNMSFFTQFSNHTSFTARWKNPSPVLCHIGSGSSHFESAVGADAINKFIKEVTAGADLTAQLGWFEEAFQKVSAIAPGCGIDFNAVLSTRTCPEFMHVHGSLPNQSK